VQPGHKIVSSKLLRDLDATIRVHDCGRAAYSLSALGSTISRSRFGGSIISQLPSLFISLGCGLPWSRKSRWAGVAPSRYSGSLIERDVEPLSRSCHHLIPPILLFIAALAQGPISVDNRNVKRFFDRWRRGGRRKFQRIPKSRFWQKIVIPEQVGSLGDSPSLREEYSTHIGLAETVALGT